MSEARADACGACYVRPAPTVTMEGCPSCDTPLCSHCLAQAQLESDRRRDHPATCPRCRDGI